ncbi:MAG: tetratricopeptide repeat protein [Kofleriaceae bacterium]
MLGRILTMGLVVGTTLTSPALAQPKRQSSALKKAEELTKQAIAKSQAGDHEAAIELYLKAYNIEPLPLLLSNIGNEYRADGKPVEALKYLCKYLDKDPTGVNASYVKAQAKELEHELGKTSSTDDTVCTAPITAKATPKPPPPKVDEPKPEPAPEITATQDPPEPEPPSRPGSGMRITGMIVGAAGIAGLGVGGYYSYQAWKVSDQISTWPQDKPWQNIRTLEKKGERYEKLQIAFLAGGGAVAIIGAVLYWRGAVRGEEAQQMTIAPVLNGDSATVTFGGQF